ncbi:MAG: hypothetical protein ABSG55_07120 [Dehalococcoidia bacterium]
MKLRATLPLAILALPVLFTAATAHAATPTPTATSTPTATATPSPQQIARFHGEEWVDAQIVKAPVSARIGEVVCGTGGPPPIADVPPSYQLDVVSDAVIPHCGTEGNHLTFMIGDRQGTTTAIWHAGTDTALNLMAGPPFALFSGKTSLTCEEQIERQIVPFIDDVPCGWPKLVDALGPPCNGQLTGYTDAVLSAYQKPGCGVEGAPITFKLLDTQGNVVATANETGVWHEWYGGMTDYQHLNLTFPSMGGAIRAGIVGDGPDGPSHWLRLSVGLALLGLAIGIGGFALRRRAT